METGQIIIQGLAYLVIGAFSIAIIVAIIKIIISVNNLPVHRLIKYRIVKRHTTFDCLGQLGEYYKYYIQEKHFFQWMDVEDNAIPYRKDGELLSTKKQRHDNYFETFKNANNCLQDLIKKRELEYQIKKAKQEDKVVNKDNE